MMWLMCRMITSSKPKHLISQWIEIKYIDWLENLSGSKNQRYDVLIQIQKYFVQSALNKQINRKPKGRTKRRCARG